MTESVHGLYGMRVEMILREQFLYTLCACMRLQAKEVGGSSFPRKIDEIMYLVDK